MNIKTDNDGNATIELPPPGTPDIEIARAVKPVPIMKLAEERLGLAPDSLIPHGHFKAKLDLSQLDVTTPLRSGKLVLVTAVTPTPAGEGKTTTSVGLSDGLNALGVRSAVCLREPSLGPCFGMKGGAAGGGRAQAIPMEDLNLHFNGDFHAVTAAHNLLASMIDNHLHWGNTLGISSHHISWRRVVDLNDRSLRNTMVGLGGSPHGIPRETGFDITAASEIMAILCLAENLDDMERRLGDIIVGRRHDTSAVTARDLGVHRAMTVLLKEAFQPNLIQSLEHNPVFVHGGPFANIAHGCNSVVATRAALALCDVAVTEAGFGADLGAEKFLDIKCRLSGMRPDAAVLVCTLRALKMQGGVAKDDLAAQNLAALREGATNLKRHIENLRQFGLEPIICINRFSNDHPEELEEISQICQQMGTEAVCSEHWAKGSEGTLELARAVLDRLEQPAQKIQLLYHDDMPLPDKIRTVASRLYGAADISFSATAAAQLEEFRTLGYGHLPVCIAKTQYSFSANPALKGAPEGHPLPVREARLSAGAGFVVAICGDMMTLPGLPRHPAALDIGLDSDGNIEGLF